MNHARWSIDFISRSRHRTTASSSKDLAKTVTKPASITDLVLAERQKKVTSQAVL